MSKGKLVPATSVKNLECRWKRLSDVTGQMLIRLGFGRYFWAAQGDGEVKTDRILFAQHPSVVCVIEGSDGRLALVHNWRPIRSLRDEVVDPAGVKLEELGEYLWEFPGGLMELGEIDQVVAAIREGGEETGWVVENAQTIGWYHPDPANNTTKIPVVLINAVRENDSGHDVSDGIDKVRWVTFAELLDMTRAGELSNGHTRNALLSYLLHRGLIQS